MILTKTKVGETTFFDVKYYVLLKGIANKENLLELYFLSTLECHESHKVMRNICMHLLISMPIKIAPESSFNVSISAFKFLFGYKSVRCYR